MTEQKEIKVRDLNDDGYLTRITSDAPLTCVTLTCKIAAGSNGAGYLSKELINKMVVVMKRAGYSLTCFYVSPEDVADVIDWEYEFDSDIEREVFKRTNTIDMKMYTRYCLKEGLVYGFSFVNGVVDAICVGTIDRF